ncbi:MAG TPA: acyltransferase [Chloroflexota bacterium]|nr:acyltransferase [Chloroflexota bacterium]
MASGTYNEVLERESIARQIRVEDRSNAVPRHIPELDGLRAVAVLTVMMFHLQFRGFSLGWSGVMLFFVISGFLITGILLDTRDRPHYLRNFYMRRVIRILPIYYLTLAVAVAIGAYLGQDMADIGYYLTYTQNYLLGDTNFTDRLPVMLNHTWSLAIEEQFYLLWPLAVLWLSRNRLLGFLVGLFAVSILARLLMLLTLNNPTLVYTSLPTELDSLSAGAVLAVLVRSGINLRQLAAKAVWVGALSGGIILALVELNGVSSFWHPSGWATELRNLPFFTLMALFWASIISIVALGNSRLSPLLRLRPVRQIGKVSYGLYIYHFPVYVLVDLILPNLLGSGNQQLIDAATPATKVGVTLVLALLSWHLLEEPTLRLKSHFR